MSSISTSELVRRYFGAYQTHDRKIIEDGLTDDFTFTSPYDDAIDKTTYFERCWPNHSRMKRQALEKIMEQGDQAFVMYEVTTQDGLTFRNTELLSFQGDKLRSVQVFFGASYKEGKFVRST